MVDATQDAVASAHRAVPRSRQFDQQIDFDGAPDTVAIGVVAPFDFEMDWEYIRYLPEGVQAYFTRTPYLELPVDVELAMRVGDPDVVADATRSLQYLDPAATLYACASGSFIRGLDGERQLRERMVEAGASHAATSSGALIDALHTCSIERVALALPYSETLAVRQAEFLEAAGFTVTDTVYLGLEDDIERVSHETITDLARESARRTKPDAVFIGCTAMRTFGLIGPLERDLQCPVFTANQVSLWRTLLDADPSTVPAARELLGAGSERAISADLLSRAA